MLAEAAVVLAPVESRTTLTPYVRWGDWFVGFCAALPLIVSLLPRRKQEPKSTTRTQEKPGASAPG